MPFGLKNAGACFQKVMDDALAHHFNAKCYINDVLIYSTTFEQHLAHIRQAFDSIAAMGLKSHPWKCVWCTGNSISRTLAVYILCTAHGG